MDIVHKNNKTIEVKKSSIISDRFLDKDGLQ